MIWAHRDQRGGARGVQVWPAMWKTHAAFTFGGAGPSRCISTSVLDFPNSSCLDAPEPRRLKQEGVPVFQYLDHLSQSRQSGFP